MSSHLYLLDVQSYMQMTHLESNSASRAELEELQQRHASALEAAEEAARAAVDEELQEAEAQLEKLQGELRESKAQARLDGSLLAARKVCYYISVDGLKVGCTGVDWMWSTHVST
jgi:vacuolar-type H+-ATPase subunit I/STV1